MGIEYYAFALFISALICLIAILCKVLFANVKGQQKLLDEKETKLMQLYQTVESIMEEFDDQVKASLEEVKEYEGRAARHAAAAASRQNEMPRVEAQQEPARAEQFERLPRVERVDRADRADRADPGRMRAANEALARAERIVKRDALKSDEDPIKGENTAVFQRLFDETAGDPPAVAAAEAPSKQARNETILALAEEGKTDAEIAHELSITQNEVKLVIDLTRKR